MPVITAPTSPTHEVGGTKFTSLATPRLGSARTSIWQVEIPAGEAPTPHELTEEEIFVVLDGAASVTLDGKVCAAGAGDSGRRAGGRSVHPCQLRRGDPAAALLPAGRRAGSAARRRAVHPAVGVVTQLRAHGRPGVVGGPSGGAPGPAVRDRLPPSGCRPA